MAIDRKVRYPGRWADVPGQPQGAFINKTGDLTEDGSFIESDWANDWAAFFSSVLRGEAANGTVDEVGNSQLFDRLIDLIVPVGIVITSVGEATDLASQWPGTGWEQVGQGRYIMGAGEWTDGDGTTKVIGPGDLPEGRYLHTLDETEMPVHSHSVNVRSNKGGGNTEDIIGSTEDNGGTRGTSQKGGLNGETQPHNNMPPGFAFYYYKRIS